MKLKKNLWTLPHITNLFPPNFNSSYKSAFLGHKILICGNEMISVGMKRFFPRKEISFHGHEYFIYFLPQKIKHMLKWKPPVNVISCRIRHWTVKEILIDGNIMPCHGNEILLHGNKINIWQKWSCWPFPATVVTVHLSSL